MKVKEATIVIHSLSEPSKMPGYGYGLPTRACVTGSKLREKPNTVCSDCYACKGRYTFAPVQAAQEERLKAIEHKDWIAAMVTSLQNKKVRYFRWHDSGDLQSVSHLRKIITIAEEVPTMDFWLPTKERGFLLEHFRKREYLPENLCTRLSASLIDQTVKLPESLKGLVQTSSVHDKKPPVGFVCGANKRGGACGDCRACWSKEVDNTSYPLH